MDCSGLCDFDEAEWPPARTDMQLVTSDTYTSEVGDVRTAGAVYPMPQPPADIWWMVRLEFEPSEAGCAAHLDAEGRCFVESGPWRWLTVPVGEPPVISLWGEDFTEGGLGNTQLDWYEPEGVVDRRVYYATCRPDCDGTVPSTEQMHRYTRHQVRTDDDGSGQVGLLFRQPGPGPVEVWWTVELDFPPDHPRCDEPSDGCTMTGGPWRYYLAEPSAWSPAPAD